MVKPTHYWRLVKNTSSDSVLHFRILNLHRLTPPSSCPVKPGDDCQELGACNSAARP